MLKNFFKRNPKTFVKKVQDHDTKYCNLQFKIFYMVYINNLIVIQQRIILNTLFFIKLDIILEY